MGSEGERETSMRGCLLHAPYWGPSQQPRHVPYWESNWWPFGSQAGTQSTEPLQPGLINIIHLILLSTLDAPFQWEGYTIFLQVELLAHYLGQMSYIHVFFIPTNDIEVSNFWYSLETSDRIQNDFVNWESVYHTKGEERGYKTSA